MNIFQSEYDQCSADAPFCIKTACSFKTMWVYRCAIILSKNAGKFSITPTVVMYRK